MKRLPIIHERIRDTTAASGHGGVGVEDSKAYERNRPIPTASGVELTVVIPTFNERNNIIPLLDRLEMALSGLNWEAILVDDDSPDGTAHFLREVAQQNQRVRVIHRIGRRGLASACVEGVLSSSAPYFAVINADMQHDKSLLPKMFKVIKDDGLTSWWAAVMSGAGACNRDRRRHSSAEPPVEQRHW